VNCGGGGGGGGGARQAEPAGTDVPSGHTTGGGGGGGGQGCVVGSCVPSIQVCITGALGVVAQADSIAVAKMATVVRFIALPSRSCGQTCLACRGVA
jgi:hypothetical protein